jgi:hypothetical protein
MKKIKEDLEKAGKPVVIGGLYQGIDDVASNVTYTQGESKIVGKKLSVDNRLSLREYDALTVA